MSIYVGSGSIDPSFSPWMVIVSIIILDLKAKIIVHCI